MKVVRRPLFLLFFVVSIVFLFEGHVRPPVFADTTTPNKLEIARTPGLNNSGSSSTEVVSRAQLVQDLYTHTLSLPAAPSNQICPMYLIATYRLTFLHDYAAILHVNAIDGECHSVTLDSGDVRIGDSTFWKLLNQAQSVGLGQNVRPKQPSVPVKPKHSSLPAKSKQPSVPTKKSSHGH